MKTRPIRGLLRAAWLNAVSYRLSMALALGSLVFTVVPVYFVAGALQPLMAGAIATEGEQYFGFLLVGTVALSLVTASVTTLPNAVGGGISSGYFESLLVTPSSRPALLVGLSGYGILWTLARGLLTLGAGWFLGARMAWDRLPSALLIVFLVIVAHWAIGLIGTALVLAFRTMGPLPQAVLVTSALFGGVYYPTAKIPSWLQAFAVVTPLSYGSRALRHVLLEDGSIAGAQQDVLVLTGFAVLLLAVGWWGFERSLEYARRAGSLNLY